MRPEAIPCPACGAKSGQWCVRHGRVQAGALLCCVARVRSAGEVARGLDEALASPAVVAIINADEVK